MTLILGDITFAFRHEPPARGALVKSCLLPIPAQPWNLLLKCFPNKSTFPKKGLDFPRNKTIYTLASWKPGDFHGNFNPGLLSPPPASLSMQFM